MMQKAWTNYDIDMKKCSFIFALGLFFGPASVLFIVEMGVDPVFENLVKPFLYPLTTWVHTVVYRFLQCAYIGAGFFAMADLFGVMFYLAVIISCLFFWAGWEQHNYDRAIANPLRRHEASALANTNTKNTKFVLKM